MRAIAPRHRTVLLAGLLASTISMAASAAQREEPTVVEIGVGETRTVRVPPAPPDTQPAPGIRCRVRAAPAAGVEVWVRSAEFSPELATADGSRTSSKAHGDYWDEYHAWLAIEVGDAATIEFVVRARTQGAGAVEIRVRTGPGSEPAGTERLRELHTAAALAGDVTAERGQRELALANYGLATKAAYRIGDWSAARSAAARALEQALVLGRAGSITDAELDLAAAEHRLGHVDAAREGLERVVASLLRPTGAGGEEDPIQRSSKLVSAYDLLGRCSRDANDPAREIAAYRAALDHAQAAGRADWEISAARRLGDALLRQGRLAEAADPLDVAVRTARQPNVGRGSLAEALLDHARLCLRRGDPRRADSECAEAIRLEPAPDLLVPILGTQVEALISLARYEEAEAGMVEIEELCREHGIEGYTVDIALHESAILLLLGEPERARELLERTLAEGGASVSADHRARILQNLVYAAHHAGDPERARAHLDRALAECAESGQLHREAALRIWRARLLEEQDDVEDATTEAELAARAAERDGDPLTATVAAAALARLSHRRGEPGAIEQVRAAAARLEALGEPEIAADARHSLARMALDAGDEDEVAATLDVVEELLESSHEGQRLDVFQRGGLRSRFAEWGEVAQDLAALRVARAPAERRRESILNGWRAAAEWKGRVLLERIDSHLEASAQAAREEWWTPPKGGALIEFAEGDEELFAYVSWSEGVDLVSLGARADAAELVQSLIAELARREEADAERLLDLAARAYTALWLPVVARIPARAKDLAIVPTPELSGLPFEALVEPESLALALEALRGEPKVARQAGRALRYVDDRYCLAYSPSSLVRADLARLPERQADPRYLVLGDPLYWSELQPEVASAHARGRAHATELTRLEKLERTREEAVEIWQLLASLLPQGRDAEAGRILELRRERDVTYEREGLEVRLGRPAARDALQRDLSGFTHLHLAAHGHIDPIDPRRSGLVLSYEDPSGGLLTVEDVLELDAPCELVVLSACDTARGPIVRGEGVQSLCYAFLAAGARSVVASQWRVGDANAADLMKRFYGHYLGRVPDPANALQRARVEFRQAAQARGEQVSARQPKLRIPPQELPCAWAAFVYVGRHGP